MFDGHGGPFCGNFAAGNMLKALQDSQGMDLAAVDVLTYVLRRVYSCMYAALRFGVT